MLWAWIKFTCVIDTEVGLWPKKRNRRFWWNWVGSVVLHFPAAFFIHHGFKRLEIISLPSSTNASDITQGKEKWKTFSLVRRNHLFEMVSSASPRRNYAALPRLVSSASSECRLSIFGFPCKQLRVSPLEDRRRSPWRTRGSQFFWWRMAARRLSLALLWWSWKVPWKCVFICCQQELELLAEQSDASSPLWFETPSTELPDEEILLLSVTATITVITDPFLGLFLFLDLLWFGFEWIRCFIIKKTKRKTKIIQH